MMKSGDFSSGREKAVMNMIDAILTFIKKLTGNLGLKIVSLGLAFLLWLFVVSIENPVMTLSFTSIPVTVENADVMEAQGKAFELADSSRTVTVTVKADRSVLSELSRDNIKATVDMTELDGNRVPIAVKSSRYSDRIQAINPAKEYANVLIEDLAHAQFRIVVETTGSVPEGYAVGSTSVANNVVRVSGPESIVSSIAEAKVRINVSGMTSEIHTDVPILLLDEDGDPVDTSSLEISLNQVNASAEIWKVVEIPIHAGFSGTPAPGYLATGAVSIDPSTVFVTGDSKALSSAASITIPSTELDITGAVGDTAADVNISSLLPSGVYLDSSKSDGIVSVTAEVVEASAAVLQVPYANLTPAGLPEGMIIGNDMATSLVAVTVRGLQSDLDVLNGASITGTLDLSGIPLNENGTVTPGSYAGEVVLALPQGVTQDTAVAHVLLQMSGETTEEPAEGAENGESEEETGNDTETE